jgi:hypothetical protein
MTQEHYETLQAAKHELITNHEDASYVQKLRVQLALLGCDHFMPSGAQAWYYAGPYKSECVLCGQKVD